MGQVISLLRTPMLGVGEGYPRVVLYGRGFDIVQVGSGGTRPIIDYLSVSLAEGTILHDQLDSRWDNLWIVRGGATDLSQPGVTFNWLERYSGPDPRTTTPPAPAPTEPALSSVEIFIQQQGWVKQSNGQWTHPATGAVGYFLPDGRFVNATTNQVFDPATGLITQYSTVLAPPPPAPAPAPAPAPNYPPIPAELAPAGGITSFFTESVEIVGYQIPMWALLAGGAALLFAIARKR